MRLNGRVFCDCLMNNPTRGFWGIFSGQPRSLEYFRLWGKMELEMLKKKKKLAQSLSFNYWALEEVFREVVLSSSPCSCVLICRKSLIPGEIQMVELGIDPSKAAFERLLQQYSERCTREMA